MSRTDSTNYQTFRDCLCEAIISKIKDSNRKSPGRNGNSRRKNRHSASINAEDTIDDAEDLADFIDYIALELFSAFPDRFQCLSFEAVQDDEQLAHEVDEPLPVATTAMLIAQVPSTIAESLDVYQIAGSETLSDFLIPVYQEYAKLSTARPLQYDPASRSSACEICGRDWIPLTYHHLIPRQVHAKVLKRKWHEQWQLDSVAWLCRACHSYVHRIAGNEELARQWWTVELLMSRDDVQSWAKWVSRLRWKGR